MCGRVKEGVAEQHLLDFSTCRVRSQSNIFEQTLQVLGPCCSKDVFPNLHACGYDVCLFEQSLSVHVSEEGSQTDALKELLCHRAFGVPEHDRIEKCCTERVMSQTYDESGLLSRFAGDEIAGVVKVDWSAMNRADSRERQRFIHA